MTLPRCSHCGGNLGTRDEDGELHCLLCGARQGETVLPVRLVSSRHLDRHPLPGAGDPP